MDKNYSNSQNNNNNKNANNSSSKNANNNASKNASKNTSSNKNSNNNSNNNNNNYQVTISEKLGECIKTITWLVTNPQLTITIQINWSNSACLILRYIDHSYYLI